MSSTQPTLEVRASREFPVPIERAYAAWTESDLMKQWWGPEGFTCPVADMDVREGGTSLVAMRAPAEFGGRDYYNTWKYSVVDAPHRLEYEMGFADENGSSIRPGEAGVSDAVPHGVPHIVTFDALDGDRTRVSVTEFGYTDEQTRDMSQGGLDQCLDKLERLLSSSTSPSD